MKPTRPTNEVFTEQEIDSFYAIGKQMLEDAKRERGMMPPPMICNIANLTTMSEKELVKRLKSLRDEKDKESRHEEADRLLLDYIGSDAVRDAFNELDKWYA